MQGAGEIRTVGHVVSYPRLLLETAKKLLGDGEFGIAVVVAHMACEIAAERAISDAFAAKGLEYLKPAVEKLMNGRSLGNPNHRRLYTALTADEIEQQPFWQSFRKPRGRVDRACWRPLEAS
jgi:hypothetical protein